VNVLASRKSWKGKRGKLKGERDYNAALDFSPGIYDCMSTAEELEEEKGKKEKGES
jgi:hypothetical protein